MAWIEVENDGSWEVKETVTYGTWTSNDDFWSTYDGREEPSYDRVIASGQSAEDCPPEWVDQYRYKAEEKQRIKNLRGYPGEDLD